MTSLCNIVSLSRYSVKVTEEQLVSLQMTTSKHDVYVRLCILDNEEEVISAVGKGHVVIAACILHKDMRPLGEEAQLQAVIEPKRSTSRTCTLCVMYYWLACHHAVHTFLFVTLTFICLKFLLCFDGTRVSACHGHTVPADVTFMHQCPHALLSSTKHKDLSMGFLFVLLMGFGLISFLESTILHEHSYRKLHYPQVKL